MKETIVVYSKVCLDCTDERWQPCRNWLINRGGYLVKFRRTALNPIWHSKAKNIYGSDCYPPFALMPDGKVKNIEKLEDEVEKAMSKVRRNTTKKSTRVGSVARKKKATKKEA